MNIRQLICIVTASLSLAHSTYAAEQKTERWVVYYTDKLPASAFEQYDLIAFDSDSHPPIADLKAKGKTLLGYISFGEAEDYRSYYKDIKAKKLFFGTNKAWKDHHFIDVRKPEWTDMLINQLIPPILAQGFDGIMIDTMDSVVQPELDDPVKYRGMKKAAIQLIKDIRTAYPDIKIMMNRGFEILPDVASDINYVMAESIYTDVKDDKPYILKAADNQYYLDIIAQSQAISPSLKVYSIDYWGIKDSQGVKHIYDTQRAHGFVPYVSTVDLQKLYTEPK